MNPRIQTQVKLPFFTLILLISFASVNAVLFTPALPDIGNFFHSGADIKLTVTLFLIGYTFGQLLYGPIANRFGRKPALYTGVTLQILSSLMCAFSANLFPYYSALLWGRFFLALGSGVGLKMTFTLINECYAPSIASQKISTLMLSFAITPALAVAVGGWLNTTWGWSSCFYASAIYGFLLLLLCTQIPETLQQKDHQALNMQNLLANYWVQFKNIQLVTGGFLMGLTTAIIYLFAAVAPFVVIQLLKFSSAQYGTANLIPAVGLVLGSLYSAQCAKKYSLEHTIKLGIFIALAGCHLLLSSMILLDHQCHIPGIIAFFLPMTVIYFGISLILPNVSALALQSTQDKAHGSAVMNFINMGTATFSVILINHIEPSFLLLPCIFYIICIIMLLIKERLTKATSASTSILTKSLL